MSKTLRLTGISTIRIGLPTLTPLLKTCVLGVQSLTLSDLTKGCGCPCTTKTLSALLMTLSHFRACTMDCDEVELLNADCFHPSIRTLRSITTYDVCYCHSLVPNASKHGGITSQLIVAPVSRPSSNEGGEMPQRTTHNTFRLVPLRRFSVSILNTVTGFVCGSKGFSVLGPTTLTLFAVL